MLNPSFISNRMELVCRIGGAVVSMEPKQRFKDTTETGNITNPRVWFPLSNCLSSDRAVKLHEIFSLAPFQSNATAVLQNFSFVLSLLG